MKVTPIAIGGAAVVQSMAVADHRGAFARLFCVDELAQVLGGGRWSRPIIRAPAR
ncbi:hypothetical protein ACU4GD_01715 [Cupriavidus basilensis]